MPVPDQPVVLTGISIDDQLLAVPQQWALAELRTAALLARGSTLGEVRQDAAAAAVLALYLDDYRQSLLDRGEDEEDLDRLTSDAADYDPSSYFSDDDQLEWQAYAEVRASTADWLAQAEPVLNERYTRYDEGDGPMYNKARWIAPEDRDAFERDLRHAGYRVRPLDALHGLYLEPPLDLERVLGGETS